MGNKPVKWAPSPGSLRVEAALARQDRWWAQWWVRWVGAGVLGGVALVVWNERCGQDAPGVFGGDALEAAPTELPYPDPY